jgi:hypothetical protein
MKKAIGRRESDPIFRLLRGVKSEVRPLRSPILDNRSAFGIISSNLSVRTADNNNGMFPVWLLGDLEVIESKPSPKDTASDRYAIVIVGGNAVFLSDRLLGHNVYLGTRAGLTAPELRRYVLSLCDDLETLSKENFFAKHGLSE